MLFADHQGFDVIYSRLSSPDLPLGSERPVVARLLKDHPYALFVFSNNRQDRWHFLNVKYDPTVQRRTLFRRITVGPGEQLRTATERLSMLDLESFGRDLSSLSALDVQARHDEAFDVEKVTKKFFEQYAAVFDRVERLITGISQSDRKRLFTQRLFNRLMFIAFIQKKGWLNYRGEPDYLPALWRDYLRRADPDSNFYRDRLQTLFFAGLNTSTDVDVVGIRRGGVLEDLIGQVPYLNGGLFEEDEDDRDAHISVPDEAIDGILHELFDRFNFTVTESTPLDVEVAVDPEMLGKVFEELVTGRHETGSYYTPKPVVSFMCKEALKGYLASALPTEQADTLWMFVDERDPSGLRDAEAVLEALRRVTMCDPACGSGAYLLGMLHELLELRSSLFASKMLDPLSTYQRKLEIIQSNLYGVDLDPFAVNIARLRLWLSLAVDFDGSEPLPLPNLDFKVEVGDSLLAPDPSKGLQMSAREKLVGEYLELKGRFMTAHGDEKQSLKRQIESARRAIELWTHGGRTVIGFDWPVEFAEVFAKDGFDVVVMNPPYVSANRIPGDLREEFADYMRSLRAEYGFSGDLYVHFMYRALQILKGNGVLSAITSSTFLTNMTKEYLRRHLLGHDLRLIVPLSPEVFTATVYSAITVVQKDGTPDQDERVFFSNLRRANLQDIESPRDFYEHALQVPVGDYRRAFGAIFFEPTLANRRLFGTLLSSTDIVHVDGRAFAPLGLIAPALDTGIHTGNVRHRLFYKDRVPGKRLYRLIQGTQVVRYGVWWESPAARYRYVDIEYEPDLSTRGVGRGGKPSGRGEYWHFCGSMENHHVPERLLMRQTEDEPYVGYIYQGKERVYTDNTIHTLILTDDGKRLGLTYYYLLAILNSDTLRRIYRAIAQEEGRTLAQVKTAIVNRLPIAVPSQEESRELETLVSEIRDIYQESGIIQSSPQIDRVAAIQAKIDQVVSNAYRLALDPV